MAEKMRLTVAAINEQLRACNQVFGSRKSDSGLVALAEFWLDSFEDVKPQVFAEAMIDLRKNESFFPVPAVGRRYVEAVQKRRQAEAQAVPQVGYDEQIPDKAWVRALLRRKGLIDADGRWIDRGVLIAERYLTAQTRPQAEDTGKRNKAGDRSIFRVRGIGGGLSPIDPGGALRSVYDTMGE